MMQTLENDTSSNSRDMKKGKAEKHFRILPQTACSSLYRNRVCRWTTFYAFSAPIFWCRQAFSWQRFTSTSVILLIFIFNQIRKENYGLTWEEEDNNDKKTIHFSFYAIETLLSSFDSCIIFHWSGTFLFGFLCQVSVFTSFTWYLQSLIYFNVFFT